MLSGKKQRVEYGRRNLLTVLNSPLNQTGMRSILPKPSTTDSSGTTTTITVPTLTITEASRGPTAQLILLTNPVVPANNVQTAITISQPFFNTHLGLMAKPPLKAPVCAKV